MSKILKLYLPKDKRKWPDWYKKLVKENKVPWWQTLQSYWSMYRRRVRFEFVPRDCWIGFYWHHEMLGSITKGNRERLWTDIYICIIPCFPLHIMVL